MREDLQEKLEKLYPRGCILISITQGDGLHIDVNNPGDRDCLEVIYQAAKKALLQWCKDNPDARIAINKKMESTDDGDKPLSAGEF